MATELLNQDFHKTLREELLPRVHKPGQYLGSEFGSYQKDWDKAKSRIAIIYPDLYELGMSNFGIKILYNIANKHPDYMCDRAYAPMPDMEALLKERDLPLWGWESYKPLNKFDMLGFSLGYELVYTNILTILDLTKIPFLSKDRTDEHPLIFAGGPAVFNPEVMADYIDFYLIGDGEDLILEIQDCFLKTKNKFFEENPGYQIAGKKDLRNELLFNLAQIQGVYVPSLYKADESNNFIPEPIKDGVPLQVKKRVAELNDSNQPTMSPVPNVQSVQDKQTLEIRRGCDRGCRFCQIGYTALPVRERSPEELLKLSNEALKNTGYEDYSLLSLSASDYTCLTDAARAMNNVHAPQGVSLSMPSQRADRFNVDLAAEIQQVRKSGVTLAPEAGTERMRKIINKGLREEEIRRSIKNVYSEGWDHVKLYFMIGLPFEEDSDLDGILDILSWSLNMAREVRKEDKNQSRKKLRITCTISTFVPKSFTPFQWFPQCTTEEFDRKQKYLLNGLKERGIHRSVKLNCTEPDIALLESVLSRGDRRWGQVVKEVWDQGSRLDAWSENFNAERWGKAAKKFDLDLHYEASKNREAGSKQPWDVLTIGFTDDFLIKEWEQAKNEAETSPCTENKCHACGVCFNLGVKNIVTEDQSDNNPFVSEIDKEYRQKVCSQLNEELEDNFESLRESSSKITIHPESTSGQKIVVKNYEAKQKLRFVISKKGDLRFISHLDFQRLVERALRRTQLPIVHTTGFNQRIKLRWGNALPLFIESEGEYLELELAEKFDELENLKDILNKYLPKQAKIISVEDITSKNNFSISNVFETIYKANLISGSITLEEIENFVSQEEIIIEKIVKGKQRKRNIKESFSSIKLINEQELELIIKGNQKAEDILNYIKPNHIWKILKTKQTLEGANFK